MSYEKPLKNIVHLRGIMALFVVVGHAMTIFVGNYAGHQMIESFWGRTVRTVIYSFHMPVFMAISGFLFYNEVLRINDKNTFDGFFKFVKKKAKRLLIPFVIVFYLWRKPLLIIANPSKIKTMSINEFLGWFLSVQTTGALWFLYVLFAIFIFQRLFINIIWKNNYSIWICFILFGIMSIFANRFSGPIHHFMLYNTYFYAGAVLHRYENRLSEKFLPVALAISSICTIYMLINNSTIGLINAINIYIVAIVDIYIAFELSKKLVHTLSSLICYFSDKSMGIYLFHEPLILALGSKLPENWGGVRLVFSFMCIGLSLSIITTLLIRKLKLGFVLGE